MDPVQPALLVLASVINFLTPQTVLYTPTNWRDIVLDSGLDGLEWRPFRGLTNTMILWNMVDAKTAWSFIASVEQSFRSERNLAQILRHPSPMTALKAHVIFPYIADMRLLGKLVKLMGDDLPVVMYPDRRLPYWNEKVPTKNRLFQLTQEVADKGFVPSHKFLDGYMFSHGFDGIVLDLYHLLVGSDWVCQWQTYLEDILPLVKEVHIGLARSEHPEVDSNPDAFLSGEIALSEQGRILIALHNLGWQGRVVLEIPPGVFVNPCEAHATIAINIRRLFVSK